MKQGRALRRALRRSEAADRLRRLLEDETKRLTLWFGYSLKVNIPVKNAWRGRQLVFEHDQTTIRIYDDGITALRDFLNKHFPE